MGTMNQPSPKKKLSPPILAAIVAGALVVVLAGAYCGLCSWVRGNDRLLPGTVAADSTNSVTLDLSGLSREDAAAQMLAVMNDHLGQRSLTIQYGEDGSATLSGSLLAADPESAVEYGLSVKESQPFLSLGLAWLGLLRDPAPLSLSASSFTEEGQREVDRLIDEIADALYVAPVDFTYEIGETDIQLTTGVDGVQVDQEALMESILNALATGQTELTVETVPAPTKELTGDILSQLVYQAPQSPQVDENGTLTPTVVGISIDPAEAQAILDATEPGQTCSIPVVFTPPDLSESEQYLYQDLLASATSNLDGVANRSFNVGLAAASCNGVVIMPGEVFSYLGTIGSPSQANGYKMSTGYQNGETVDMVGGGICQVSSSLYYCAVYSNLEIVRRAAHAFTVGYLPNGLDATVYYPSLDFKFRNNTGYPIKVVAYTTGGAWGKLTVQFYGTNPEGTYVKTERYALSSTPYETVYEPDESIPRGTTKVKTTPYTGYEVEVYRCVYSADGTLLSRTFENYSKYAKRDKVILYNPADAGDLGLETPTPSPDPSPDPSVDPSPDPSPSTEPTPTPTPQPTPSPEPTPAPESTPAPSANPEPAPSTAGTGGLSGG